MGPIRIATMLGAAALLLGAAAEAQAQQVPPGLSGAEQYVETSPTVTGGKPTDSGGGGGRSPAAAIGRANAERLDRMGADGQAAARLAAEGAPKASLTGSAGRESGDPSGSSRVGQVVSQLTGTSGSSGMGLLLPLLIASGAIAATAFGIGRRRSGRTSQLDG